MHENPARACNASRQQSTGVTNSSHHLSTQGSVTRQHLQRQVIDSNFGNRTDPGTVTRLLADFERGDPAALEALFPIVYDELRRVARRQRDNWNGDNTLDTTALVHEVYLKLAGTEHVGARTRVHFLRIASRAMRHILSNYSRDRRAFKRGGAAPHIPLDMLPVAAQPEAISYERSETLAALEEALQRLETVDKRLSEVVECRFFGGLTIEDTAAALGVSPATVKREWSLARAWLFRELSRQSIL
jgi:RNA polymerase sigma factor (TIGR02999 family)